jgi:O-Antigen ligase
LNDTNHNFYGFICGIGFLLMLNEGIKNHFRQPVKYLISMPVLFLGVLMSTSRSALFGVAITIIGLCWMYFGKQEYRKLMSKLMVKGVLTLVGSLVAFALIQKLFVLDNSFIDNIYFRLVEEPLAVFRKYSGQSYDIQQLDAMDWRAESAAIAWQVYLHLPPWKQLLGVGIGGYLQNNLGHNELNPHNGYLYLLIESGLIGCLIYFSLVFWMIKDAIQKHTISSLLLVMLFIMFYSAGQNDELITASAMITISSLISENGQINVVQQSKLNLPQKNLAHGVKRI